MVLYAFNNFNTISVVLAVCKGIIRDPNLHGSGVMQITVRDPQNSSLKCQSSRVPVFAGRLSSLNWINMIQHAI